MNRPTNLKKASTGVAFIFFREAQVLWWLDHPFPGLPQGRRLGAIIDSAMRLRNSIAVEVAACEIVKITDSVVHVRIRDVMKVAAQKMLESVATELIGKGKKVKLFAIMENFKGWEKSES